MKLLGAGDAIAARTGAVLTGAVGATRAGARVGRTDALGNREDGDGACSSGAETDGAELTRGEGGGVDAAGAGVGVGDAIGTGAGVVGTDGAAGTVGSPGSCTPTVVEPGAVTVTSIGAPPVPPDTETDAGSWAGGSGAGSVGSVGTVTVKADAGTPVIHSAPAVAAKSVRTRSPDLDGTTPPV